MDRELHRVRGSVRSIGQEPAKIRGLQTEMIPTNKETTVSNFSSNFARSTGQHHEVKRHAGAWARIDSPSWNAFEHCCSEWSRKLPCAIRFRISVHRLGKSLDRRWNDLWSRARRSCRSTLRSDFHRSPSFISFRVREPRAASMDGPLCCVLYATSGWIKSPNLVASITLLHTTKKS